LDGSFLINVDLMSASKEIMRTKLGLSKEGLVEALHERGYSDVTLRQVTDWRSRHLLPTFDLEGISLGRAQGRKKSQWSNGALIIEQSVWIIELLNLFGDYTHVYSPLWLLGYPVRLERLREGLSRPLQRTIPGVQRDCTPERNLEDILNDDAHTLAAGLEKEDTPAFRVPADAIDLILNLFINPEYDLTDLGAFEAFQLWQAECQRLQASWSQSQPMAADSIESLLKLASTVKQHLSVTEIKRAIDEATDDDLRVITRDIAILRRMWLMFTKILARELPKDFHLPNDVVLRLVFGIGEIAIYFDIALRKHGEGGQIDSLLPSALSQMEVAFHKKFGDSNSHHSVTLETTGKTTKGHIQVVA
jgi:hypothetical protein